VRRVAALVALLAVAAPARADTADTFAAFGYVVPMGFGAIATAVDSTYLAYDEPAPRHWRLIGWIAGGVDVALGAGLLAFVNDRSEGLVLGGLALGVGAASVLTATFVGEESHRVGVVPVAGREGAGLVLWGRL
jgi:hypothetical protein